VCADHSRDSSTVCVVELVRDLAAIEASGSYRGLYHVLGGRIAPLDGVYPENLNVEALIRRIKKEDVKEIIIATNPTVEGEATAHYLFKLMSEYPVKVTRLAMGLPVGADIDFADQVTIKKSLEGRTELT